MNFILIFVVCMAGLSLPAQADYLLAPGDLVQIAVYGENDLSPQIRVDEIGRISYPFLGYLRVGGLTTEQLKQAIHDGLKGDYLIDPKVSVSIVEYRSFYVGGAVREPGNFSYEPGMSVRKALSLAGGATDRASLKKIFLVRDGASESDRTRVSLDDPLGPGDILTVEESFF
ncbi:MAG: polysaccharide biosynthesis/export family protein [Lysobacterales bacterium]